MEGRAPHVNVFVRLAARRPARKRRTCFPRRGGGVKSYCNSDAAIPPPADCAQPGTATMNRTSTAEKPDKPSPPELPSVRILIVDDDKAICDYMQTLLERDGFHVKTLS